MATVVGTYSIFVPPGAWAVGPTFRKGESVRVRAGGEVRWGGTSTPNPPTLSPYHWGDVVQRGSGAAVPWSLGGSGYSTGTVSLGPGQTSYVVTSTAGRVVSEGAALAAGATVLGVRLRASVTGFSVNGQLDDDLRLVMSLLVGGSVVATTGTVSLPVGDSTLDLGGPTSLFGRTWSVADLASIDWTIVASSFLSSGAARTVGVGGVLVTFYVASPPTLVPSGSHAYPEGTYPPDFGPVGYPDDYSDAYPHDYDPSAVLQASQWGGDALACPDRPPLSLAVRAFPDGVSPPFAATPGSLGTDRDRTLSPKDLVLAGAIREDVPYRLWFVVNDALDASTDTGGYTLLVDRLLQPPMPLPLASLTSPRFGRQTQLAARAAVSRMLGCIADKGFKIKADQTREESGTAGFGVQTGSDLIYDVSSGDATLNLDTLDTGYLLYALCGGEAVVPVAAGVYDHVFQFPVFTQAIPPKHSVELPTQDGEMVQRTIDLIFNGLKIGTDPTKMPTASTAFMGGQLVVPEDADLALAYDGSNTGALTPGQNSVQTVSVNGAPTSGSYVLYDEFTQTPSGTINVTDAASAVQTAVRLMGGVFANALVAGTIANGILASYTITSPTGKRIAKLEAMYTGAGGTSTLVGGTTPSVTVAYTNSGGFPINPAARCGAQSWVLSLAPNWTAIENAPVYLTDGWSSDVTIAERWNRKWIQGAVAGLFDYVQKEAKDLKDTLELEMAFMPQVRQFINSSRSGSRMAARLQSNGAAIGATGYSRFLRIDMDGQAQWDDVTDSDNVRSIKVTLNALYNVANGQYVRIVLRNEIPSYGTM